MISERSDGGHYASFRTVSPPLHDMSRLIEFFEQSVTIFFRLRKFFDDFSEKNAGAEKKAGDDSS